MSNDGVNQSRRKFLLGATGVVGGAGIVGAAVPFVASWQPSAKAKAAGAPVKVNIAQLEAGGRLVVEWRGKPVYIVRRTQESLAAIDGIDANTLKDANSASAKQPTRAFTTTFAGSAACRSYQVVTSRVGAGLC